MTKVLQSNYLLASAAIEALSERYRSAIGAPSERHRTMIAEQISLAESF